MYSSYIGKKKMRMCNLGIIILLFSPQIYLLLILFNFKSLIILQIPLPVPYKIYFLFIVFEQQASS